MTYDFISQRPSTWELKAKGILHFDEDMAPSLHGTAAKMEKLIEKRKANKDSINKKLEEWEKNANMCREEAIQLLDEWALSEYVTTLIDDEGYDDIKLWPCISWKYLISVGFNKKDAVKFVRNASKLL